MVERWVGSIMKTNVTLMGKIMELEQLPDNWDGYGASPPTDDVIEQALEVGMYLPIDRCWSVVPGSDGSIQIETHSHGFDIEINIAHHNNQNKD